MKKKRPGKKALDGRGQRTQLDQHGAAAWHTNKAAFELYRGRLDEAEREARQALRIERGSHDTTLLLMPILCGSGRTREALSLMQEALGKRPKDPVLLYHLAKCLLDLGRLEEALRAIEKIEAVMERHPRLFRGSGGSRGRLEVRRLRRAIEARLPHEPEVVRPLPLFDLLREGDTDPVRVPTPESVATGAPAMRPGGPSSSSSARISQRPPSAPPPATPPAAARRQPLSVRVEIDDAAGIAPVAAPWLDDPWSDDLDEREIVLEAQRIRLLARYEDLLCTSTLTGVEKLDYQVETVRKILRRLNGRALLCDEVGLGKTIEAGMVIKEYLLRGLARTVLVLAPAGLVRQWREEMSLKFGLDFALWDGDSRAGRDTNGEPLLAIGSIALARHRKNVEAFSEKEWDLVVVDEAHQLRRRSTRSWALVNALRKRFLLLLTATPVHNDLEELFELVTLVRPGLLGTPKQFRRAFLAGRRGRSIGDPAPLRDALAEVMVRNTRSHAGIALPKRFATTLVLQPLPGEGAAYRIASEYAALLYGRADPKARMGLRHLLACAGSGPHAVAHAAARRLAILGATGSGEGPTSDVPIDGDGARRLLERIVHVTRDAETSAKTERLHQLIASTDEQMVVFCRYRATLAGLATRLAGAGVHHAVYHGALPRTEKDRAIEVFRHGARVLLSTESGGEGRNMQFCRTIVNYDLPWDPMQIEQRIGRVHRIGQTRDVFVFNLVLAATLEEELLRILEEKIHLFELVVGEVDSILGHLERREEFADILLGLWAGSGDEAERRRRFEDFGHELSAARAAYDERRALEASLFQDHLEA